MLEFAEFSYPISCKRLGKHGPLLRRSLLVAPLSCVEALMPVCERLEPAVGDSK